MEEFWGKKEVGCGWKRYNNNKLEERGGRNYRGFRRIGRLRLTLKTRYLTVDD